MRAAFSKTTIAGVATAALALALVLWLLLGVVTPGSASPDTPSTQALPSHSSIAEGPGGRVALTSWKVRKDAANRGIAKQWAKGGFSGSAVGVPNVANALPITGVRGTEGYDGSIAWYRTSFSVTDAGLYAMHFESINFLAQVWVDGHPLGSHIGTYLPFEVRRQLAPGQHTLVVRVDWRNPRGQSSLGFHRTWFNFGGINGEVSLREIGLSELGPPTLQTKLTPTAPVAGQPAQQANVQLSIEVHNNGAARTIVPSGTLQHDSQIVPLGFVGALVKHAQTVVMRTSVNIPSPALWSPSSPSLYDLTVAIGQESSYSARVGLRELTWKAGRMYINGQRLTLHGASIQEDVRGRGDALSPADQDQVVSQLKQIGANATRSQHPLDPALLERLDAAGIVVWQGIGPVDGAGNWSSTTPALEHRAELRARTTVRDAQQHPSIIAWNLANEVAGNGHPGGQAQYIQRTTSWAHAYDPGRIVAVDIWGTHPPKQAGALYKHVDAIAETDYSGWYDHPQASAAQVRALIHGRLAQMHRTFAGKVQIISEFGAESNQLNAPNSPGGYSFQSKLLTRHIKAYAADPQLSGMLIWNLRDFALTPTFAGGSVRRLLPNIKLLTGLNQKGLFSYQQRAKPSVGVVSQLYKALPAD
ncbi:MAG TPA: glycoside hydrolase family 2 TIM barrel-domain containing protein [Solirubrobacteraceae bacterium]|nr:glycoside hydrolase family 2 TIM barrel-domain containing protein [Solirubrobacteraceae bacterium]